MLQFFLLLLICHFYYFLKKIEGQSKIFKKKLKSKLQRNGERRNYGTQEKQD